MDWLWEQVNELDHFTLIHTSISIFIIYTIILLYLIFTRVSQLGKEKPHNPALKSLTKKALGILEEARKWSELFNDHIDDIHRKFEGMTKNMPDIKQADAYNLYRTFAQGQAARPQSTANEAEGARREDENDAFYERTRRKRTG